MCIITLIVNQLGLPPDDTTDGFYFGGSNSFEGDSGGPLYILKGSHKNKINPFLKDIFRSVRLTLFEWRGSLINFNE